MTDCELNIYIWFNRNLIKKSYVATSKEIRIKKFHISWKKTRH